MNSIATTQRRASDFFVSTLQVFLGGSLISLFAKVAIFLPFTPVPIILQNNLVLLMAALLGARKGMLATLVFVAQGAMGLPVFAGGTSGLIVLLGPTGGYIIGYVAAAYLIGYLFEKEKPTSNLMVYAYFCLANFFVIYALGTMQLSFFLGLKKALIVGTLPFILGGLIKNMVITKLYHKYRVSLAD